MNNEYKKHRDKLLDTKEKIDEIVRQNGISSKILNFESNLKNSYENAKKNTNNSSNVEFISFNYFVPQTYILLAKGYKFKTISSFCESIFHYIKYINSINKPDFNRWNLRYYSSLSFHILNSDIELFGNTNRNFVVEILNSFRNTLLTPSTHSNFKTNVDGFLSDFLFSLVTKSSEIYTEEHLEISKQIEKLTSSFIKNDNLVNATLESLKFILAKKKLHYYLRKLVPKNNRDERDDENKIYENINKIVKEMETIANNELKFYKKVGDGNKKIKFKKFLAEIDVRTCEYYKSLWIEKNLIKTFKKLENIFSEIRANWQNIFTPNIFSHFVQEFVFLNNYFKLLLLARDFQKFGESLAEREWQKEVSIRCAELLNEIASQFFKYGTQTSLERKLLIVEEASSGKFVEFIVFYILKEIATHKIEGKIIANIQNQGIRDILNIVNETENTSQIKWNYRIPNEKPDVDILISNKYGKHGIFLKTGILDTKDKEKIKEEINCSLRQNLEKVYQIINIAKNLDVAKELIKEQNVTLVDVGEFLEVLLDIAYNNKKIALELSKSSVLSWAGFYSGG